MRILKSMFHSQLKVSSAIQESKGIRVSKKYVGEKVYSNDILPGQCFGLSYFWLVNRRKAYAALMDTSHRNGKDIGHRIKLQYIEDSCDFNRNRDTSSPFWREISQMQDFQHHINMKNNFYMRDLGNASYVLLSKSKEDFPIVVCNIFLMMSASGKEICWDFIILTGHVVAAEFRINQKYQAFEITFFEPNSQKTMGSQVLKLSLSLATLRKYEKSFPLKKRIDQEMEDSIREHLKGFLDKTEFFSKSYPAMTPVQTIMEHCFYFENESETQTELESKVIPVYGDISKLTFQERSELLYCSSRSGYVEMTKILIESGVDVNWSDQDGNTSLLISSQHRHTEIVGMLRDAGADVNLVNRDGSSPLLFAVQCGNTETVGILLGAGANVNLSNVNGISPLLLATRRGQMKMVQQLIQSGADVNLEYKNGRTPLFFAVEKGFASIVRELLDFKADVYHKDKNGTIPLDVAKKYKQFKIADMLSERMRERELE